jgi:hypothetical protein
MLKNEIEKEKTLNFKLISYSSVRWFNFIKWFKYKLYFTKYIPKIYYIKLMIKRID